MRCQCTARIPFVASFSTGQELFSTSPRILVVHLSQILLLSLPMNIPNMLPSGWKVLLLPTDVREFVQFITWMEHLVANRRGLISTVTICNGNPHSSRNPQLTLFSYDSVHHCLCVGRDALVVARSATSISRSSNGELEGHHDMYPVENRSVGNIRRRILLALWEAL